MTLGGAGLLASSAASPASSSPLPCVAAAQAVRDVCALVEPLDAPASVAAVTTPTAYKWKRRKLGAGSNPVIVASAAGQPHVVFPSQVKAASGKRDLIHMWRVGNTWNSETIDSTLAPTYIGDYVALAVGSDGVLHVAYTKRDFSTFAGELLYARGDGSSWQIETVEPADYGSMAIELDEAGVPHILHLVGGDSDEVRYLTRQPGGWTGELIGWTKYSNYPPALQLHASKAYAVFMDNDGRQTLAVGDGGGWTLDDFADGTHCSLAIDGEGVPHVAYTDCCPDQSHHTILVHASLTESGWTYETLVKAGSFFGEPMPPKIILSPYEPALTQDDTGRIRLSFGLWVYKGSMIGRAVTVAFAEDGVWAPFLATTSLAGIHNSIATDVAGIVHAAAVRVGPGSYPKFSVHEFTQRGAKLALSVLPKGSGTIGVAPLDVETTGKSSVSVFPGDAVTLTATAAEGFEFAGWSGAISGTDPMVEVTMDHAHKVIARFVPTEP